MALSMNFFLLETVNKSMVTMSHLLDLGAPAPAWAGGFILFCSDKAGNLAVLDHKRGSSLGVL